MRRIVLILLTASVLFVPISARAVNCKWQVAPTPVNFGTYSAFSTTPVTAVTTFTIQCTPPAVGTVILSTGQSNTFNPRAMTTTPAANLNYNLFMDAANTIIWGDGTSGTQYVSFTPVPGNTTLTATVYATIPAGLNIPSGSYSDTIQATLNWGSGSSIQYFNVTATVASECTVSAATLNFGAYDPVVANATTALNSTGTVNVYCTPGTLATVSLGTGMHASGTARYMLGTSGSLLHYEVYNNAGRTVVWDTTNTDSGTSASKLTPINGGFIAYGTIFAGQDVGIGSYSDTLLVTVNY